MLELCKALGMSADDLAAAVSGLIAVITLATVFGIFMGNVVAVAFKTVVDLAVCLLDFIFDKVGRITESRKAAQEGKEGT